MPFQIFGQVKFGQSISNFSGIYGVHLNPTSTANSKVFLDINFFSAGLSVNNNFIFIHKEDFKLGNLLSTNPIFPSTAIRGQGVDYSEKYDLIYAFVKTEVIGPSFSLSLGQHSFGLFNRGVVMTSVYDLPSEIAVMVFEGLDHLPLHNLDISGKDFNLAALAWIETGLNYSYILKRGVLDNWSVGANYRRLTGHSGAYANINDVDFTLFSDSRLEFRNLNTRLGFSLPLDYSSNDYPGPSPFFKGRGNAFDFGITYRRNLKSYYLPPPSRNCEYDQRPYLFKIGISLLDLGSINYSSNVLEQEFENVSVNWNRVDTTSFNNINTLTSQLSKVFYGDSLASSTGRNDIQINLPTSLSLQADFQYFPNWYLSGALILPVKSGNFQVRTPKQGYLGLRYEAEKFEIALPLSYYEFEHLHVGLHGRYKYFFVGTDNLASILGVSDLYGYDVYFGIKFHLQKGYCKNKRPAKNCKHLSF